MPIINYARDALIKHCLEVCDNNEKRATDTLNNVVRGDLDFLVRFAIIPPGEEGLTRTRRVCNSRMQVLDCVLAAWHAVADSGLATPDRRDAMVHCVMAAWGYSGAVRMLRQDETALPSVARVCTTLLASARGRAHAVAVRALMPYGRPGWRLDGNDNVVPSAALVSLVHEWDCRPCPTAAWTSRELVTHAVRHCIATGRAACAQNQVCDLMLMRVGAEIADFYTPHSGSSPSRPP